MRDIGAFGILLSLFFSMPLFGQIPPDELPPVGIIDFYGLRRISEDQVRSVLGVKEGDTLSTSGSFSDAEVERRLAEIPEVARARLEMVCCEAGKLVLFVGIEETAGAALKYHPQPRGEIALPVEVVETYREFLDALMEAVRSGDDADDLSQGHSLMQNPAARLLQERFLVYARQHLEGLRQVLRNSADPEQREIAAWVIGYAQD